MPVTMRIGGIGQLVNALSSLSSQDNRAGVKVRGETNYIKAMVWDIGYVTRTIKPGPKTLWSVNVYGEPKVLTITAPTGFIRVQRSAYVAVLRDEFSKANFPNSPLSHWPSLIETMMANAAQRCSDLITNAAPVDTGELRSAIAPALPGDNALTESPGGSYSWEEPTFDVGEWLLS